MKIAFHSNQLCERGSEVALFDYAHFNEAILGNQSLIISNAHNNLNALDKFKDRFEVFLYEDFFEVDPFLRKKKVGVFYALKNGRRDGILSSVCKNVVHCISEVRYPHGDVYAAISEWLAEQAPMGDIPVVPHMVYSPKNEDDLRSRLGIPKEAVVFGRYGADDQFDIPFVHKVISRVASRRKDIYFLFMNTNPFYKKFFSHRSHPRIIHLPKTKDLMKKTEFINTCDAMIHGRRDGETFGLAIAEFSSRNKPVLTWGSSFEKGHLSILKKNAFVYFGARDLYGLINDFNPREVRKKTWDVYSRNYNPNVIMRRFNDIFLV